MPTPKKSDELHKLHGTKSQAAPEPEFKIPASRPRQPKDLTPAAADVFKRLCALLRKRRALTAGDVEVIRLYAILHDRHARALAKIQEEGEVCVYTRLDANGVAHEVEKENLWLRIATNAEKNLVSILDRLGLTPNARTRVKPTPATKPTATVDPFEEFLATHATPILPPYFDSPAIGRTDNDDPLHAQDSL
jgi:P27 family predicted phage terminase small subunit